VQPGRRVYVDGPYGAFNDDHSRARSLLLVAAGVGITPMMSILRAHAHRRDPRQHCLVVGARTVQELMFREELDQLAGHLDLDVVEVVSRPDAAWTGTTGRVDSDLLSEVLDEFALVDPHAFLCGPGPMVSDLRGALGRLGVPAHRVHTEEFEPL
jgi:ferredoxin-NADP reductase